MVHTIIPHLPGPAEHLLRSRSGTDGICRRVACWELSRTPCATVGCFAVPPAACTAASFQLHLEGFTCILGQFDFFSKTLHVLMAITRPPRLSRPILAAVPTPRLRKMPRDVHWRPNFYSVCPTSVNVLWRMRVYTRVWRCTVCIWISVATKCQCSETYLHKSERWEVLTGYLSLGRRSDGDWANTWHWAELFF
jgi:hypothetical protein